jgi:hypothetical protein
MPRFESQLIIALLRDEILAGLSLQYVKLDCKLLMPNLAEVLVLTLFQTILHSSQDLFQLIIWLSLNYAIFSAGMNQLCFYLRFEVFTVVTMKNGVFWHVTPCDSSKNQSHAA